MSRGSMNPGFDQRIADWLEDDPDDAPDAVLVTVLAAFPSIPQRRTSRAPWRSRTMSMSSRLLAGAAASAVVLVAGAFLLRPGGDSSRGSNGSAGPSVGSAPPGASSPASPAPSPRVASLGALDKRFTSPRHGYSVAYSAGWTLVPATKPWSGQDGPDVAAGNLDTLSAPEIRLYVESAPLGNQTASQWRDAYAARFGLDGVGECDVLPANWPRIQVGPISAYLDGDNCPGDATVVPGDTFFEAQAFTGGRVYLFWLQGAVDRAAFDHLMATVRFDPSAAVDGR